MRMTDADLNFYDEIARCVTDALDYLERDQLAIPPEVANGIWEMVDPSNYGRIQQGTIFIEKLYDTINYSLNRAFDGRNGFTPDQIYKITGQWVEDKAARMIREAGWFQDRQTGEWFQRRNSFVENRGMGGSIRGRRSNMGGGIDRGTFTAGRAGRLTGGGPITQSRGNSGGSWATAMAEDTVDDTRVAPQRPVEQSARRPTVDRTQTTADRPQRAPINRGRDSQRVRPTTARKVVEFSYKPADRDTVAKSNEGAENHALKVLDIITARNEPTEAEIKVFDLQFLLPADNKTVVTFAQTFLANENSYLARILYNDVKAFKVSENSYEFAQTKFKEAFEDIKKSDRPGTVIDSVIFDNMTRNEGQKIEKLVVDEINKRISISLFNRMDKEGLVPEIGSVKSIDDLISYEPYLQALGENSHRWKSVVMYVITSVLASLFINVRRLKRDTNQLSTLITAESNNKFIYDGLDMQHAINGANEDRKNRYLDEYFKNFIVVEMSGIVFYTDIFEEADRVNALIAQGSTSNIYEDALMAAFSAVNDETGNEGFTLRKATSHGEVTLFAKRPTQMDAFNVKFPFIPSPNKLLERNAKLDMGFVSNTGPTDGPTVAEDDFDKQWGEE